MYVGSDGVSCAWPVASGVHCVGAEAGDLRSDGLSADAVDVGGVEVWVDYVAAAFDAAADCGWVYVGAAGELEGEYSA